MNNFRPHQPKNVFGGRAQQGSDLPHPWATEEEIMSMRRQNPQFHQPLLPNVMSNMQSSLLNQPHLLPTPNKNYGNQSSCKMSNSNFMHSPSASISKHSMNEQNFPNRFTSDRFSNNNSFSNVNVQYKMNEGPLFKDFPGSNTVSVQSRKNESFPDISKQLFPNMRQPPERFSCMQNDQTSYHQKYDSPQTFQEKGFPFTNDKAFLSPNSLPYCEKPPSSLGSSFTSKPTYRAPSLFPAYTPKDAIPVESGSKVVQDTAYNSNFTDKSSSLCDETPVSSSFIKTTQSFQEKALQDGSLENALNELFQNNSFFDKPSFKDISTSEELNDSFKAPIETVTCSNDKFPFTSENQQSCFQTSSDSFQKSQSLQFSSHSNSASSKDCLLQSTAFTAETNVHQSLKESIPALNCSFNFESNISSADIADLLPGIDAFLKETANKAEDVLPKTDVSKANVFSTDLSAWSRPSIPFIGDTQTSRNNDLIMPEINTYCSETQLCKKGYSDKPEKISYEKSSITHHENKLSVTENHHKNDVVEEKVPKTNSTLEEAIDMLVTNDAIVGLDYILEYKKIINQKGSFPFKCKLCNSAISRPTIIDHIIGSKHRMRYLKAKDEAKYKSIFSLNNEESAREAAITEIAFQLEKIFGRGHVIVETEVYEKDSMNSEISALEDTNTEPPVVFTLDKIPIGFEALSPQHDDVHSTTFSLDTNMSSENQDHLNTLQKENEALTSEVEVKKEAQTELSSDCNFSLPDIGLRFSENDVPDSSSSISDGVNVDSSKNSDSNKEHASPSIQPSSLSPMQTKVKRSASPDSFCQFKQQKVSDVTDFKSCSSDNIADSESLKIKTENSPSREKSFTSDLLDELSKCVISSEEEASFALQAVNILIQMLLRYKLQHISLEVVENMMRSLQSRSPDKIEELMSLLKGSKMFEDEEDPPKPSLLKSEPLQSKCEENMDQAPSSHAESIRQNLEPTMTKTVFDSFGTTSSLSSNNGSSSAVSNTMFSVPASPTVSVSNAMNVHSSVVSNIVESGNGIQSASMMNTQTASSAGLKPPPFFNWPQAGENVANPSSYAAAQGNQNMMWTSPYQHSQTQFAQMQFYQAQGYGNTFTGNQTYQSQYQVLPQSSVPLKIVNPPPLPPPPPPPPPAPSNPPLPPLPKSAGFPSAASHSIPLSSNSLSCLPQFSKPPPPPPPPLP